MALLRHATIALMVLLCAVPATTQVRRPRIPSELRNIRGQVLQAGTNRPVGGVYVSLQTEGGGIARDARTGLNGRFEFDQLSAAVYYVVAEIGGYHRTSQRIDLTMQPRGYALLTLHPKKYGDEEQSTAEEPTIPVQSLTVPEEARREFEKGRTALVEHQDMDIAQQHLQEAIRLYPDYLDAHLLLATSYMDQEKWPEAEKVLRLSLEMNDRYAPTHFALATLLKEQGKTEEAQKELEHGLLLDPDSWQAHLELAQMLLEQGKIAEAKIHAERAKDLKPDDPVVRVVLGNVSLRMGALDDALRKYADYLELAPEGPLALEVREKVQEIKRRQRLLALTKKQPPTIPPQAQTEYETAQEQLSQQNLDESLQHFRRATEIAPRFIQAQHMIGVVLTQQQEWQRAENAFRKCFEIDDQFVPGYLALGKLYNLQNRPQEAVQVLQHAVRLAPGNWRGHFELSQALLSLGKIPEAELHAQQAHELLPGGPTEPESPLVHVLLGNIGLMQRDLYLARTEFQHYLEVAPEGSLAPQLRYKIGQIDVALQQRPSQPSQQ